MKIGYFSTVRTYISIYLTFRSFFKQLLLNLCQTLLFFFRTFVLPENEDTLFVDRSCTTKPYLISTTYSTQTKTVRSFDPFKITKILLHWVTKFKVYVNLAKNFFFNILYIWYIIYTIYYTWYIHYQLTVFFNKLKKIP